MAVLVAGCGHDSQGKVSSGEPGDVAADELSAEIARVPNPPLASDLLNLPGDLRTVPVPEPTNLADFVVDKNAAIALGKALFWDMQVGSDRTTACAADVPFFKKGQNGSTRFQCAMDPSTASLTARWPLKEPCGSTRRWRMENQISTWLTQDACSGV